MVGVIALQRAMRAGLRHRRLRQECVQYRRGALFSSGRARVNLDADHELDPFGVLGLTAKATKDEIKTAFHTLAKEYHPDTNAGCTESEKTFKKIHAAYEILQDDKKRWQLKAAGNAAVDAKRTSNRPRESHDDRMMRAQADWQHFIENKEVMFERYQNAFAAAEEYDKQVNNERVENASRVWAKQEARSQSQAQQEQQQQSDADFTVSGRSRSASTEDSTDNSSQSGPGMAEEGGTHSAQGDAGRTGTASPPAISRRTFMGYEEEEERSVRVAELRSKMRTTVRTPSGDVEEKVEEQWIAHTMRGDMERRRPLADSLCEHTKLAMKLHSSEPLTAEQRKMAVELWGQAQVVRVLKIELPKGFTSVRDKWSNALGKAVRDEHKKTPHWDRDR